MAHRHHLHRFTPRRKTAFLEVLRTSGNVRHAAAQVGFSAAVIYTHRRTDPAFAAAWEEAMAEAMDTVLEPEAIRRAVEGVEQGVYHQGKQIAVERTYSDTLLIFLLKGWKPERYKERRDVFHQGSIELLRKLEHIGQMTPDELQAFLLEAERHVTGGP